MPLESATKISELNDTNPVGASDAPSALDDHIRLIKTVLKADAASLAAGAGTYVATVGGTADAITLTPTTAITAYAAGQTYSWIASGANTTAVTINVSGLGAKAARKNGTTALAANDIPSGALMRATYDGTNFQVAIVADRAVLGVTAGTAIQVDQAVTATTRSATTTLGTSLNHTLSDTSTTITAFNGVAGVTYSCRALGAGSITHHATNLIITQTGASIAATAAGDTFDVYMITSTTSRIINYVRASGSPLGPALSLKSATTSVDVSAATAPSTGQALVATSSTAATWQTLSTSPDGAFRSVQTFTASGTYTPTANMVRCKVTVVGGGGGGGTAAGSDVRGSGGGGGGTAIGFFTAAQIGASQAVTVGAAVSAQTAGATASLGSLISATGGGAGVGGLTTALGGAGGSGTGGSLNIVGSPGFISGGQSGSGGNSSFGGGGTGQISALAGGAGQNYGGGGGGGWRAASGTQVGGAGAAGVIMIEEFF